MKRNFRDISRDIKDSFLIDIYIIIKFITLLLFEMGGTYDTEQQND